MAETETDLLVYLCAALSPDVLMGKCIYPHEELCGDSTNEFFELSQVKTTLAATEHILIGGQQRQVKKIMTFKMSWLQTNYIEPMLHFINRIQSRGSSGSVRRPNNSRSSIIQGDVSRPALTYPSVTPSTQLVRGGQCCGCSKTRCVVCFCLILILLVGIAVAIPFILQALEII